MIPPNEPSALLKRRDSCTDHCSLARPITGLLMKRRSLVSPNLHAEVLAIAHVERGIWLGSGSRRPDDALGIDDASLDDEIAEDVRSLDDGIVVGVIVAHLDAVAQIENRLVDFAERTKHVFLENHREVFVRSIRLAQVGSDAFKIFHRDTAPQHRDDDCAQDRRTSPLSDQFGQSCDVKLH